MADEGDWTAQIGKTVFTVPVKESVSFGFEADASQATLPLFIEWGNSPVLGKIDQAKRDILGYPQVKQGNNQALYLSRNLPMAALPFRRLSDNRPYLYASRLSGESFGVPLDVATEGMHDAATDWPRFRYAKCQVDFTTFGYEFATDDELTNIGLTDDNNNPDEASLARYCTIAVAPGMEYLALAFGGGSGGGFKYVNTGQRAAQGSPGKLVPNYDLSITWHQVPLRCVGTSLFNSGLTSPPIDYSLGTVNQQPFPATPTTGNFVPPARVMTAFPAKAGSGYRVGDVLQLANVLQGTAPTVTVTAITGSGSTGGVLAVRTKNPGSVPSPIFNFPTNPVDTTALTGAGTNCQLTCTFGAGLPPGTLLLTGAQIRPVRSTAGDRLYDVEYRWKCLFFGHQFLYYQGTSDFTVGGTVNVTGVSNVVNPTITTNVAHGFTVGQTVSISGVVGATGVNGVWPVASVGAGPNPTTFTITTDAPGAYTSGGTVGLSGAFADAGYFEVTTNGVTNIGLNKFNSDPSRPPVNIYGWSDHRNLFRVPS